MATASFTAAAEGYRALLAWARLRAGGQGGMEGTGCYGAALSRHLRRAGVCHMPGRGIADHFSQARLGPTVPEPLERRPRRAHEPFTR